MNLKELIKEVERLNKNKDNKRWRIAIVSKLQGIKQAVEAVDKIIIDRYSFEDNLGGNMLKDWQKLKKLLGIK